MKTFVRTFYALGHSEPTLKLSNVGFFRVWAAMKEELASYYDEDEGNFDTREASWRGDEEYADVVTLKGRIVGALGRALTQEDVADISGVNRMEKRAFANRIRSLFNIDGDLLPELTREQQSVFLRDPVRFFLDANEEQSDAIMREIEGRQGSSRRNPAFKLAPQITDKIARESDKPVVAKKPKLKKLKSRVEGQRELLLPITGGAGEAAKQTQPLASETQARKKTSRQN